MPTTRRTRKKKPAAPQRRLPSAKSVEVGDEMHVSEASLHPQYKSIPVARGRSVISGIVCSIRNVKTGKLVPKATGDMGDYVFEILDTQGFEPAFSSASSARRPEAKKAVVQVLKKARDSGRLMSDALGSLRAGPLAGLDGWRILKFMASEVYTQSPLETAYLRKAK